MLGEVMVAMRGIGLAAKAITGKSFRFVRRRGVPADDGGALPLLGGLAGIVVESHTGAAASVTGHGGHFASRKPFESSG